MATDNSYVQLVEAVDRRARITSTGGEIVTTFYVEPATAAPIVVCRLLGTVSGNAPANYTRTLPQHDHEFPFYYCVEAHPVPFDKRSVTSSPAMLLRQFGGRQFSLATSIRPSPNRSFSTASKLSTATALTTPRRIRPACAGPTSRPSTGRCPRSTRVR